LIYQKQKKNWLQVTKLKYLGIKLGLFYVASYLNLLASSLFVTIFYLGGWHSPISFVSISNHSNAIFSNGTVQVVDIIVRIFITLTKAYFFLFISIMMIWTLPRI
jgi:NAD(P)H-quinone oxidoreductase subunit 1